MADPAPDPIALFEKAFERARRSETGDPTAVTLATADAAGRPSARVVLLKQVDRRGFVFYTNYESRKALELTANPRAALCFYWKSLDEQVRVEGAVERVSAEESDAYFASRPRTSQVGAWASQQSRPLPQRFRLVRNFVEYQLRFAGAPVPRPPHWGGLRVVPDRIEFWYNRLHRLHDRRLYLREGDRWTSRRLYP